MLIHPQRTKIETLFFCGNRFHLKCSEPSVEEVDITVSVGVSSDLEERETLQDMERTPLQ